MSIPVAGAAAPVAAGLSQPWAAIIAALVGALVAGAFAIWQSVRSSRVQKSLAVDAARAQQELEKYKSDLELLRAELEQRKQASYDFRMQRLTPFLEALNNAIVESYSAVLGLPLVNRFKRHIPALVKQHDEDLGPWWTSTQEMSRLRIQVLLSLDPDAIEPVIRDLERLMQLHRELITQRNLYLNDEVSYEKLEAIHADYVRTGFALLLEIRNALAAASSTPTSSTPRQGESWLKDLPELLERSSVVSFTYGKTPHNAWIAKWGVSTGMLQYEQLDQAEFDRTIKDVATALYRMEQVLDMKLARMGKDEDEEKEYVLCVSFADKPAMENFMATVLPAVKLQSKPLWKGLIAPIETMVE